MRAKASAAAEAAQEQLTPQTFLARDNWIRGVLADTSLSANARIVAARLALFLHVKTGRCDPGYQRLAQALGISGRSVFRHVAELERAGWIIVERGDGRGKLSHFRLVTAPERVTDVSPFSAPERVTAVTPFSAERVTVLTEKGDSPDSKRVTPVGRHKESKRTSKRTTKEESDSPAEVASLELKEDARPRKARDAPQTEGEAAEPFERFWAAYPRRVAKLAARKAFEAAVKHGAEPEALIAGAQRYAVERAGEAPRFTKHPATWINAGCWQDELPAGAVIDEQGNLIALPQPPPSSGKSWADIADELVAEIEERGERW